MAHPARAEKTAPGLALGISATGGEARAALVWPLRRSGPTTAGGCGALLAERFVEDAVGLREVEGLDELAGFGGAELAVHGGVFPFDGERALVADDVQRADDLLEVDAAAAQAAEIPAASRRAEVQVRGQDAGLAVQRERRVLHVHVVDAVRERLEELDRIHHLPVQVARVEVEPERLAVARRAFSARRAVTMSKAISVGCTSSANLTPHLSNTSRIGFQSLAKSLEALLDHLVADRREAVDHVPDRTTR